MDLAQVAPTGRRTHARKAVALVAVVVVPLLICWYGEFEFFSDNLLSITIFGVAATSNATTSPTPPLPSQQEGKETSPSSSAISPPSPPLATSSPSHSAASSPSPSSSPPHEEKVIPTPSSSATTAPSLPPVPVKGGSDDPHFLITWDDYTSATGKLRVVSGAQDHRRLVVPANWNPFAYYHSSSEPHARLFQFHAAYWGNHSTFREVSFWIYSPKDAPLPTVPANQPQARDSGRAVDATGKFNITKLAVSCKEYQPRGWSWRIEQGVKHNDLVLRCKAFLPPELVDQALCINSRAHDAECKIGHVVVYDTNDGEVFFPMSRVMHFPTPTTLFPTPPPQSSKPFPSAPWRAKGQVEPPVVRTQQGEEAAKVRTCAWVPKKFSWDAEDELWLLWMLDIVGVDFVAIYMVPSNATGYDNKTILHTTTLDSVRQRLQAHEGLSERVLLIESDIPGSLTTFEHMVEAMHWDAFLRLQADCDYGFALDTDEFVNLYGVEPPHERVDIKTFITQRRDVLNVRQSVYMVRLQMRRMSLPGVDDETMPPFFVRWLHYSSANRTRIAVHMSTNNLGKSLWKLDGILVPYLHFPEYIAGSETKDNIELSNMLHIRLAVGFTAFSSGESGDFPQPVEMRK